MDASPLSFVLRFEQQQADLVDSREIYQANVVQAPGRGWGGPFLSTGLDSRQIQEIRNLYQGYVARYQQSHDSALGQQELHLLRLLGKQLFEMLPESVQEGLRRAQTMAREQGRGLALTLQFEQTAQPLLDLPWELLCDPAGYTFYALQGGGLSRQLIQAGKNGAVGCPESILGLWAAPAGLESLETRQGYEPAPGRGNGLTWLEGANSLEQLQQALASGSFDGLHIVAHGRLWADFALGLVAKDGSTQWLEADQLAALLSHYPTLKLVYLDVCSSGQADKDEQGSGGLARFLLGAGLPAVIVMQDELGQDAAGRMAQAFYRVLAEGGRIDEGVTAGRRAIRLQANDPIQWSIPALYARQFDRPKPPSPIADWVLDRGLEWIKLPLVWLLLALAILVGQVSYQLADVGWDTPAGILTALPYLVESALLPIFVAAATRQEQDKLQQKYRLTGRSWLPILLQKYFSAFIWSGLVWFGLWLVGVIIYLGGLSEELSPAGMRLIWSVGLTMSAMAAHVGARQAIRQNLLFLRVGYSFFRLGLGTVALLLFALTFYLIGPVGIGFAIYFFTISFRLSAAQMEISLAVLIVLLTVVLFIAADRSS